MKDLFVRVSDGDLVLTVWGYVLLAAIIFAVIVIAAKVADRGRHKSVKTLVFSAVCIALATVLGTYVKLFRMPMGGSVTLFSMFFVTLVGYWYGLSAGLLAAVAYGLIQFVTNPYILSLPQVLVDYVFAFGALGLSGLFAEKKNGLILGFLTGVTGRFIFSCISGIVFFGEYASGALEGFNIHVPAGLAPFIYSFLYNGAYIYAEAAITVAVLLVPAVRKALMVVKNQAVS